jgi:hypothetical protein
MTGTSSAGLWRGRAVWAEHEREQACAKWNGEASVGAGGAQKGAGVRGRATWPGISECVCGCARVGPRRGTGKAELTGQSHDAARGSGRAEGTTRCADEVGPRGRDRKRARERGQPVPTTQPHWAERGRERERAGKETAADRWNPLFRRRGHAAWLGRARPVGLLWLFLFPWNF